MRTIVSTLSDLAANRIVEDIGESIDEIDDIMRRGIRRFCAICHAVSVKRGWWKEPRNFGEMIALIHSELSEGMEGGRTDAPSDKIPEFSMFEEELADACIRIGDLAYAAGARLDAALAAKIKFNLDRTDHDLAVRAAGGKQF